MRTIVANRIDERLIHGQVMTSWIKQYDPNKILIIDAASANNTFLSRILFAAAPKILSSLLKPRSKQSRIYRSPRMKARESLFSQRPQLPS